MLLNPFTNSSKENPQNPKTLNPKFKQKIYMELSSKSMISSSNFSMPNPTVHFRRTISFLIPTQTRTQIVSSLITHTTLTKKSTEASSGPTMPTMAEILDSSKSQNLDLQLQTVGPFFRITARSLETKKELGKAEGLIRVWVKGRILHLESIRLKRETLAMEKSIFGIGLFLGAVAIRYGYDCGCGTAELLAINDSDIYHHKLVRFYSRIGFKAVHEVTGSTFGDYAHMLLWGGIGTRMDASVEALLIKWCTRFKSRK